MREGRQRVRVRERGEKEYAETEMPPKSQLHNGVLEQKENVIVLALLSGPPSPSLPQTKTSQKSK